MFIQKKRKNKVEYINLSKVSYVNVTRNTYTLNMCYSYVDRLNRIISAQHFMDFFECDLREVQYFKDNFIEIRGDDRVVYVNKQHISSVIAESAPGTENNKIIITFTNSVTKQPRDVSDNLIAEYLFVRMTNANVEEVAASIIAEIQNPDTPW